MASRIGGSGRHEQFIALYRKYYKRIVGFYIHSFRFSPADAEDLTQEAFLRFYQTMDDYRGESEWKFFETIARNVAYNKIRSSKTLKRNAMTVEIDDPDVRENPRAAVEPDFVTRQEAAAQRRELYKAIATLPPGQRECVHLWLEDMKYEEIAAALRISLDAVKSRLRDAKRLLRTKLGDGVLPEETT